MAEAAQSDQAPARASSIFTTYLSDRAGIIRALKTLRDQRAPMMLRFKDQPEPFTAKILDVSEQEFLLEDIQPRIGRQHMSAGATFSMSGRVAGLYLMSEVNRVIATDAERGIPYFHIALPESVLYQQRRRTARFRLPLKVSANGASVTLFRNGDDALAGRIIDLSAGGCRAEFDGPVHPPLDADEEIGTCAISIPNLLDLNSKAAIRHFAYNKRTRTLTCGIELTEMHVTDRRRLEQFIQSISKLGGAS